MSDIPTDIYREILIKVPAEPLLRCRSVCKDWLSMIDDPAFVKSHLNLHRHRQSDGVQLIMRTSTSKLHSFSLDSFKFTERYPKPIKGRKIMNLLRRGLPRIATLPLPSCDGLILISRNKIYANEAYSLWALRNPFTRESLELPQRIVVTSEMTGSYGVGLGYDLTTDDYKVVSIVECHDGTHHRIWLETFVYTLKSGRWRKVEDLSFYRAPNDNSHGVYLNGSLYWICHQIGGSHYSLIAFDLGTESYIAMQLPENLLGVNPFLYSNFVLDVLDGSLFLSRCYSRYYFGLWMIEVNGGHANYKKLFSSNDYVVHLRAVAYCVQGQVNYSPLFSFFPTDNYSCRPRAVAYCSKEMMVLINYGGKKFFWFDINKRSFRKFTLDTTNCYLTFQVFQPSLFRLKDWGGVDGRETTYRKRKRAADELDMKLKPVAFKIDSAPQYFQNPFSIFLSLPWVMP